MDNKTKRQSARSQLGTATILIFITTIRYLTKGHLNYINIAVGCIGLIILFVALRTFYLLKKQGKQAEGVVQDDSQQLN